MFQYYQSCKKTPILVAIVYWRKSSMCFSCPEKKCQESHVKNHSVSLLTCNCKDKWFTWSWKIYVLFISIQSLCVFWDVFESYPHQKPWIEINMLTLISLCSFSFFSRLCYWIKHRFFFSDNKNHDFLMWMDY